MTSQTIVGVFGSMGAADRTRRDLLQAGLPPDRISVSGALTADGIAAEYPGQSFENQPGQPPDDSERSRYAEAVRTGVCVVSVYSRSLEDRIIIEALMRRNGARQMTQPPL